MKKGDKITITDKAKYDCQTMKWTEECTGLTTLNAGDVWYHASSRKITSFYPKTTCFANKKYTEGQYYALKVINTIKVESYGNDEVRIDLDKYKNDVEIYYIGTIKRMITDEIRPDGRGGFSPVFKETDNTIKIKGV
jgi:hypothetical protein